MRITNRKLILLPALLLATLPLMGCQSGGLYTHTVKGMGTVRDGAVCVTETTYDGTVKVGDASLQGARKVTGAVNHGATRVGEGGLNVLETTGTAVKGGAVRLGQAAVDCPIREQAYHGTIQVAEGLQDLLRSLLR